MLKIDLLAKEEDNTNILVGGVRAFDGKHVLMIMACTLGDFNRGMWKYEAGEFIQDAFPFLSANEREFLLTGFLKEEWDAIFPERSR
jgi:hypothetical protein